MRETFKPIHNAGDLAFASFASPNQLPSFTTLSTKPRLTTVQRNGLRYEKRAQAYLDKLCRDSGKFSCICNPWIIYRRLSDPPSTINFCQPDCLLVASFKPQPERVIVVEIKLQHTSESWRQLRQLYEPTLRHIYPTTSFSFIEMCKWFDPHTNFPETFYYAPHVLEAEKDKLGVHVYKPRGRARK